MPDRAVDEAEVSSAVYRSEAVRQGGGDPAGGALGGSGGRTQGTHPEGRGKVSGGSRILQSSGAEEIQTACARISESLSRIFVMPGLQRVAAENGSAAGQDQRTEYLRGVRTHRG